MVESNELFQKQLQQVQIRTQPVLASAAVESCTKAVAHDSQGLVRAVARRNAPKQPPVTPKLPG